MSTFALTARLVTSDHYASWLRTLGVGLFEEHYTSWQLHKGALMPATVAPCFVNGMTPAEEKSLLEESGALLLRYSSDPCDEETEWWYVVCDSYDARKLSSKVRNQISKGTRACSVRVISAEWLASNGYACYLAAHSRYKNVRPSHREIFRRNILRTKGGPFEYWGVFVDDSLSGYCQCVIEEKHVTTNVIKFDPAYLKYYVSYALVTYLIQHYVVEGGSVLSNGSRSVAHDTNFQDLLLKLGFRKQFCRLNVLYRSWLGLGIGVLYPVRHLIGCLPESDSIHKLQALLFQEELRRLCR